MIAFSVLKRQNSYGSVKDAGKEIGRKENRKLESTEANTAESWKNGKKEMHWQELINELDG